MTLWDTEVKGLGVRVQRGTSKSYILQYRCGAGRGAPLRKLTIGTHGSPWTPETARHEAKRLLGLVEAGKDPAADRALSRAAPTVTDLAERFLIEHVDLKRKKRTGAEYRRLLDTIILPAVGRRKRASDVTRQDVARLHHACGSTPYQANRVMAVLGKMFTLAEMWGLRPDHSNPCRHIEKFKETKRQRMLSSEELGRLGEALSTCRSSPNVVAAIKLLTFTGARLSEVLGLRWDWPTLIGEARLPDSKTGAKTLHLPPPALAVLADLPRIEGNPFVIVGQKEGAALVNLEKPWRKIRRAAALDDVRLHDLRHAYGSIAVSNGMGLPILGKLLGHSQPQTMARYAHLAADPVKAAAAVIADRIVEAMNRGAKGGKMIGCTSEQME